MKQAELILKVAEAAGVTRPCAEAVVKALGEISTDALVAGLNVTLPGLGKISVTARAARNGRNPATGAAIKIAARRAAKFSASVCLKGALNPVSAKGKAVAKK